MNRSPPRASHKGASRDVYLVLDDSGRGLGRRWREADEDDTDRDTLIQHLLEGYYIHPARIVVFNTTEGWCRDVTADIADELRRRFIELDEISPCTLEFVHKAIRH